MGHYFFHFFMFFNCCLQNKQFFFNVFFSFRCFFLSFVSLEFRSIGTHSHLSLATSVGNRSMTSMWRERCDPKTKNTKNFILFWLFFLFPWKKLKKLTFSTNFASQLTYVESQVYQLFFWYTNTECTTTLYHKNLLCFALL